MINFVYQRVIKLNVHAVERGLGGETLTHQDAVTAAIITLDWKEFSDPAFKEFREALKDFGLYLGDADIEINGESTSDTYYLYIARKKLPKETLSELIFPGSTRVAKKD